MTKNKISKAEAIKRGNADFNKHMNDIFSNHAGWARAMEFGPKYFDHDPPTYVFPTMESFKKVGEIIPELNFGKKKD